MKIDVVIPTYNRRALLRRTLDSLLAADVPAGLEARVVVVDNNSTDETRQEVEGRVGEFGGRLRYVFETRQGRSPALNAGIRATDGDLVGTIDDDEEVDRNWFSRAHAAFAAGGVDFIGGRCLPRWGAARPDWLPADYPAVIGEVDSGDRVLVYDDNFPGILMGGNAVFTRAVLDRVGLYSTALGRNGTRLLTGEDEDMYKRLLAAGARGLYLPDLVIYHYVPPERLTKRYYRRWCFWHSVSQGVIDRASPQPVTYLGGVPRHLYGHAARRALRRVRGALRRDPAQNFSDELAMIGLAGFFYGKHLYRLPG